MHPPQIPSKYLRNISGKHRLENEINTVTQQPLFYPSNLHQSSIVHADGAWNRQQGSGNHRFDWHMTTPPYVLGKLLKYLPPQKNFTCLNEIFLEISYVTPPPLNFIFKDGVILVFGRIEETLEQHQPEEQHGFRSGRRIC